MKAVITEVGELQATLVQEVSFNICLDDDTVLSSTSVTCMPSEAEAQIKNVLVNFNAEYQKSLELNVGDEIV